MPVNWIQNLHSPLSFQTTVVNWHTVAQQLNREQHLPIHVPDVDQALTWPVWMQEIWSMIQILHFVCCLYANNFFYRILFMWILCTPSQSHIWFPQVLKNPESPEYDIFIFLPRCWNFLKSPEIWQIRSWKCFNWPLRVCAFNCTIAEQTVEASDCKYWPEVITRVNCSNILWTLLWMHVSSSLTLAIHQLIQVYHIISKYSVNFITST